MRVHLLLCKMCQRYTAQLRFLHKALGARAGDPEIPEAQPTLAPEARERIRRSLEEKS
jgi:hypothetical protein